MHKRLKTIFYSIILTAAASQLHATTQDPKRLLVAPSGLSTDKENNVYVTDFQDKRGVIYKYNPRGERLSEVTEGFSNNGIGAIAIDKRNGVVYFTTSNSLSRYERLWKADPKSQNRPESIGILTSLPTGLTADGQGNLYISGSDGFLMKYDSDKIDALPKMVAYASKVLGVDSKNRVYYMAYDGKTVMRATPQPNDTYKSDRVKTNGSCDALAIDDRDNLFIADKQEGTIRKYFYDDSGEYFLSGHYGDLSALAITGRDLYIANGTDGVLKVDAVSGWCAGTKLFQIDNPYDYFVRGTNGQYYMSYNSWEGLKEVGSVDEYDSNGTFTGNIANGTRAKGLTLDKDDNLVFTMYYGNVSKLIWRPAGKSQVEDDWFLNPEGLGCVTTKNRLFLAEAGHNRLVSKGLKSNGTFDFGSREIAGGLEGIRGVAAADNGDVYWVSTKEKAIGRAKCLGSNGSWDNYNVNKTFIGDLNEPEAVAVDKANHVYVTNSCADQDRRHIGRYSPDGKRISEFYAYGMRDVKPLYSWERMYLRDMFVDSNGRDIIVLQRTGNRCEVWNYSNIFAQ